MPKVIISEVDCFELTLAFNQKIPFEVIYQEDDQPEMGVKVLIDDMALAETENGQKYHVFAGKVDKTGERVVIKTHGDYIFDGFPDTIGFLEPESPA